MGLETDKYDKVNNFVKNKIDRHALEDELVSHSEMFSDIREHLYLLRAAVTNTKNQIDICYAELNLSIRRDKLVNGVKVTEAALDAEVKSRSEYRDAVNNYTKAMEEHDKWDLLKQNMEAREFSIRQLVQLYQANYWVAGRENTKI